MLIDKRSQPNWTLFVFALLLSGYGLLAIYSATNSSDNPDIRDNLTSQIIWICVGLALGLVISYLSLNIVFSVAYFPYVSLVVLLAILAFVPSSNGVNRWFQVGPFHLQPSELMKPALVLALARFISDRNRSPNKLKTLFFTFLFVLLPFILVLKQPDLGTSLTYLAIVIPMLYWRGLSTFIIFAICTPIITFVASFHFWTFFVIIVLTSLILIWSKRGTLVFWVLFVLNISVGIFAPVFWNSLHEYQKQRILTFLGLISDPQGVGYQIIQSKVAIGSGGIIGKGFLHGTQTQLRFLPAQHTDFIFSVLAEEWGFIGAIVVLLTFFLFLRKAVEIGSSTKNMFAGVLIMGIMTVFAFQLFVNVGMTLGIMPVTGIPLPFISYGGSAMITNMLMVGILANKSVTLST
ncbi:rod shape-determining protein RodA [candidate division KSB1 bacterium]|nr:rod shape-determining protein RodA [candidate division KSB1 bacterium]